MKLKQKIKEYYSFAGRDQEIQSFSILKIYMLYPLTMMDDNLLNLISGLSTGLFINIFTGFIIFEAMTLTEFWMWIARLISAVVVNYSIIRIAIICTILRIGAHEKSDFQTIKRDQMIMYRIQILDLYNENYNQIKKYSICGFIGLFILLMVIIVIPIINFLGTKI